MNKLDFYVEGKEKIAISGHVKPDGDCVGSTLAVYNYIKDNYPNITTHIYLESIPHIFDFLGRSDEIYNDSGRDDVYDLFICLDCGDEKRLGDNAGYFKSAKNTICIDHHISNTAFADENYVVPDASSTCELVYGLLDEEKITKEIAECLYVGIVHDTGVFQYSCTSSSTMVIAGKLMDKGIDYSTIVDKTFFEKTFEQNQILGTALIKAVRHLGNKCISSIITAAEMKKYNVQPKHLEGIVAQLRSTKDVDVAIFMYETPKGDIKVSLRSNGAVDVAAVSVRFGGGGHVRAAGITIADMTAEDILQELLEDIKKAYERNN